MIAFDFEYYKPSTIEEANHIFIKLKQESKKPIFYGGGTEIISMARANSISMDAVIDIKGIPETKELHIIDGKLSIGSGVSLTKISESKVFPFLGKAIKRIADHTIQGKITLGGNVCGTIIYKEAVLPLLLTESAIVISGNSGIKKVSLKEVFDRKVNLKESEFILKFIIDERYLNLPFAHVKRTRQEKVDYPLINCSALKNDNKIRIAFSGLCEFPFRSENIEKILNNNKTSLDNRIKNIKDNLPGPVLDDNLGSAEYRKFTLDYIIRDILERIGG